MSVIQQILLASAKKQGGIPPISAIYGNSGSTQGSSYTMTDIPEDSVVLLFMSRARTSDGILDMFLTSPDPTSGDLLSEWYKIGDTQPRDSNDMSVAVFAKRFTSGASSESVSAYGSLSVLWSHICIVGVDTLRLDWLFNMTIDGAIDSAVQPLYPYVSSPSASFLYAQFAATSVTNTLSPSTAMDEWLQSSGNRSAYTTNSYQSECVALYTADDYLYYLLTDDDAPDYDFGTFGTLTNAATSSNVLVEAELPSLQESVRVTFAKQGGSPSTSFSLPAVKKDEMVIVAIGSNSTSNLNLSVVTAGWTGVVDLYANSIKDSNLGVYYKIYTEDTPAHSITLSHSVASCAVGLKGVNKASPLENPTTTSTRTGGDILTVPTNTVSEKGVLVVAAHGSSDFANGGQGGQVVINPTGEAGISTSSPRYAVLLSVLPHEYSGVAIGSLFTDDEVPSQNSLCAATLSIKPA